MSAVPAAAARLTPARRSILARLTALVAAGLAVMAVTAGSAAADSGGTTSYFNFANPADNGSLSIYAGCYRTTRQVSVTLGFQTPLSTPQGLWVSTRIYVKNRTQPWSSAAVISAREQFVRTVTTSNVSNGAGGTYALTTNAPATIVGPTSYTGIAWNYYDVGVYYRVAQPGGTWSKWFWTTASSFDVVVNSYGNRMEASTCML